MQLYRYDFFRLFILLLQCYEFFVELSDLNKPKFYRHHFLKYTQKIWFNSWFGNNDFAGIIYGTQIEKLAMVSMETNCVTLESVHKILKI